MAPIPQLGLHGSALVPLGPDTNTLDTALEFSRTPIFSGGGLCPQSPHRIRTSTDKRLLRQPHHFRAETALKQPGTTTA